MHQEIKGLPMETARDYLTDNYTVDILYDLELAFNLMDACFAVSRGIHRAVRRRHNPPSARPSPVLVAVFRCCRKDYSTG